jgi:hypothetical protein
LHGVCGITVVWTVAGLPWDGVGIHYTGALYTTFITDAYIPSIKVAI